MKYYLIDEDTLDKLQQIERILFGDGSILTPDQRRDAANYMHLTTTVIMINEVSQEQVDRITS